MENHLSDITHVIQLAVAPAFLLTAIATLVSMSWASNTVKMSACTFTRSFLCLRVSKFSKMKRSN